MADAAAWELANAPENRWRARERFFDDPGWWWDCDRVSDPREPPLPKRRPGRPRLSPLQRAEDARVQAEQSAIRQRGAPLDRRRADAMGLYDERHAARRVSRSRKSGMLDGNALTLKAEWLLAVSDLRLAAGIVEEIASSTAEASEIASEHGLTVDECVRVRSVARIIRASQESDGQLAETLGISEAKVKTIRSGEHGPPISAGPSLFGALLSQRVRGSIDPANAVTGAEVEAAAKAAGITPRELCDQVAAIAKSLHARKCNEPGADAAQP